MKKVFADTHYWIALANPRDEWHDAAKLASGSLNSAQLITTDEVLGEFVNYFSASGADGRKYAVRYVRKIMDNPNVHIEPQTREGFLTGIDMYESREDKAYSRVDCIPMTAMLRFDITEVLTHDHHFDQEGFTTLLRSKS